MRDGPRCFGRDSSCPALLRNRPDASSLRVRGFHPLRPAVPGCPPRVSAPSRAALQPRHAPLDAAGLGCAPFDRLYSGYRCYFLFLRVLRCFSSPRSPPRRARMAGSLPPGCPIRISADQRAFAPPRGFSQLVTSFFASESPGIPHAPFRLRCALPESGILLPNSGVHSAPRAFSAYLGSLVVSSSGRPAHPRRRPRDLRFASSMSMSFLRGASRTNPGRPAGSVFFSVENNGFEPLTPCLQSRCSSQLS